MKKTIESKNLKFKSAKAERAVFVLPESEVKMIAKIHFGYKLSEEELSAIQPAMECFEVAAPFVLDAIMESLRFIINPAKCNWKLVNPEERESAKTALLDSKEYFSGTRCGDHPIYLSRIERKSNARSTK